MFAASPLQREREHGPFYYIVDRKHKHKHSEAVNGGGKLKQTLRFLGQGFYNRARGAIFFSYFRILASIRIPKSWAFGQCILHDLEMNISAILFV